MRVTEEQEFRYTLEICVFFLRRAHLHICSKCPVAWHHIKHGNNPEEVVCVICNGSQQFLFMFFALIKWLLGRQIRASISICVCFEIKIE